ncbi:hypothetical protein [Thioclava atlantica]|uniref:Sulfotransferase domain family protein n=1 Tax=Thioclava atlantica TaxID=1317124 RepID=A0A085TRU6_9RHOB|nr:hypothetical protein [Thioclava atlantica]KFE33443.1 sulfotransferase domain family protein [Thioclava atlantica]
MRGERTCIFVNGIWKSGNHLIYSAMNELGIEGPFGGIAAHLLFGRGKQIKRLIRGSANGIDVGLETEARVRPAYIHRTLRRLRGRIVGGHAAYSPELIAILRDERARMILIRRDPRDMLISFADWVCGRPDYFMHPDFVGLSREHRVARLLHGGVGAGYRQRPFAEVLARAEGWLTAGDDVLNVAFEDLIGPQGGGTHARQTSVLLAVSKHLGLVMPRDPGLAERIYGGSLTFNKGRSQRWRELDSADLQSEIAECLAPQLGRWGYGKN